MTPEERVLRAKLAVNARWAKTPDRSQATAPARAAFDQRFLREVDPENKLDPTERAKRAANARAAHYARMTLRSSIARRKRAEAAAPDPVDADGSGGAA